VGSWSQIEGLYRDLSGGQNHNSAQDHKRERRRERELGSLEGQLSAWPLFFPPHYDPRAKIIKNQCDKLLEALKISDPQLDISLRLEQAALNDPYFIDRKLSTVDFYSGFMMRATESHCRCSR
jgi:hypothetical protein